MLLTQLQERLALLYEVPTSYNIIDFLITDPQLAAALTPPGHSSNNERVLVSSDCDDLALSVYVAQDTMAHLAEHDPIDSLHEGNMPSFLLALEGVSHFQYLCWNAGHDKSVTLFELELQAEVDKYVAAISLLQAQGNNLGAASLHRRLFDRIQYTKGLDDQHLRRYQNANRYAAKYCQALSNKFPSHDDQPTFVNELRRFYRLTQNEKIRRIENNPLH